MNGLSKIIVVCRDAYWKIAGEEIGVGKTLEIIYIY